MKLKKLGFRIMGLDLYIEASESTQRIERELHAMKRLSERLIVLTTGINVNR